MSIYIYIIVLYTYLYYMHTYTTYISIYIFTRYAYITYMHTYVHIQAFGQRGFCPRGGPLPPRTGLGVALRIIEEPLPFPPRRERSRSPRCPNACCIHTFMT